MRSPLPQIFAAALLALFPSFAPAADPVPTASPADPAAEIRTPPAPATPRINGPRVYGARPGHPFFYHLPVTGERPLTFAAQGLPAGLTLDPATGNITGVTGERGTHAVEFTVTNAHGSGTAKLDLVIGDTISLTPPLGWNSWNHFASRVTEADVRAAADAMAASGLIDHGWTYVNIDDCWQGERDAAGNMQGNKRVPDLKALGDYIHAKGLKFGIYSSPGPKTCGGYLASYQHEDQDARTYADWGVDYVKYDLCSYRQFVMNPHIRERALPLFSAEQKAACEALNKEQEELQHVPKRTPEQNARFRELSGQLETLYSAADPATYQAFFRNESQAPYRVFGQSLAKVPRDIVYSLCQYGQADVWEWAPSLGGNSWRTTGDIRADWKSISGNGFSQDRLAKYAGPGHWNDPDMLEIGNHGLNPDECYTHMTLWCLLASPLLIGCDMSKMDPLTVSLFSNDEVLAVDQDRLGQQGHRLKATGTAEVWVKPLADGAVAVGLFNRGEATAEVSVSWAELNAAGTAAGKPGPMKARDLWRQKPVPSQGDGVTMFVAPHGAELLRVGARS